MIYFIIMIVFSPFTAVIPAIYAANLIFKIKLKIINKIDIIKKALESVN